MCAYACAQYDLSRGQGPGGLIQTLKFCWEENEDLKNSLHLRLQITAFSRWATGLQSSLFHWSAQRSVCIKYSKNGLCILARWLFQFFFLTLISAFSSVFFFYAIPWFRITHYIQNNDNWNFAKMQAPHTRQGDTRSWWVASDITLLLSALKLPTFLSDHLDELTGCAGENPSTDKALYPACFLKDTSCPLNEEGNWTSLFHGERMSACEMRQVCVSASVWSWCTCLCVAMTDNRSEKHEHGD